MRGPNAGLPAEAFPDSIGALSSRGVCGMALADEIQARVRRRQYEFSRHALDQSIIRDISVAELEEALRARPEVIEDHPDDKYGPSCLILGFTKAGRPLHVQCSYPSGPLIKIVTLYEPSPDLWVDFRRRTSD